MPSVDKQDGGGSTRWIFLCSLGRLLGPKSLALMRRRLWRQTTFPKSLCLPDVEKVPRTLLDHMNGLLRYAV